MAIKKYTFRTFYLILCFNLVKSIEDLFDNEENFKNFYEHDQFDYSKVSKGPCNVPVESASLSQSEFLKKYAYNSPVIIRRSAEEIEKNKLFTEKCQLDNILNDYGEKYVTVSTANTYSYKKFSMKLSDYLNQYVIPYERIDDSVLPKIKYGNETWYFFGENNNEWKSLLNLYDRPKYNLPNHEHAYSFGIAAGLTGVPFHFHGPGFAETVLGLQAINKFIFLSIRIS